MPLYQYRCPDCGHTCEVIAPTKYRNVVVEFCLCGNIMDRVFTPPYIRGETVSKS